MSVLASVVLVPPHRNGFVWVSFGGLVKYMIGWRFPFVSKQKKWRAAKIIGSLFFSKEGIKYRVVLSAILRCYYCWKHNLLL
jgi:hypothetical protein